MAQVPNRSPSFGDGPASAPKEAAKGVKLDDTRLPMVSHTADRKKLDKALSREQFEAAKRNVDSALKEVTTGRKSALKKDREESEVKHTRKGSKRETPKEVLDKLDTPKMNLSKEAGKIACKRLLDGLVRPAKAPEEKKAKVTKGKMKKAWFVLKLFQNISTIHGTSSLSKETHHDSPCTIACSLSLRRPGRSNLRSRLRRSQARPRDGFCLALNLVTYHFGYGTWL